MDNRINEFEIARLTIQAKKEYLPSITGAVHSLTSLLGFDKKEAFQLELVVEEACLNVIEHAFDPDEKGQYDVVIERRPGKLVVGIEDKGLPFDFAKIESAGETGLGMLLIKSFADEVRYVNLGRQGKRLELVKVLPYKDVEEYISADEKEKSKTLPQAPADSKLYYQMMTTEHCVDLARCVYRSYGYSYPNDTIYFPERRKELLESGLIESCIVLNEEKEIVGHLAMIKNSRDAMVAESGQAVVDPRYRGRNLFKEMKIFLSDYARKKGMYGLYSEAVSIHPFTQKGNISLGAHETGVLLAYAPASMNFKKIKDEVQKQRQTTVLFYHKINEDTARMVYLPFHHKTVLRKIYEANKLNRTLVEDQKPVLNNDMKAAVDVAVFPDFQFAFLQVAQYGSDFPELIEFRLNELLKKKMDCIYIDLPLSDINTPHYCAAVEQLGFSFAGIIPELFNGDVLRLQYLNNQDVDPNVICTASDFGKEILDYVLDESLAK